MADHFASPMSVAIVFLVVALGPLLGWALANEQWLIVVALAGVLAIPALIRWPVVLTLGLYGFLIPFDSVATVAGGATLTRLLGMAAGGTLLIIGLMERRLERPPTAAVWWAMFLIWGATTAMWAIDPDQVFSRLRTGLSLYLLYLVAVSFRATRKEMTWVIALTIAGGVAAATAAYMVGLQDAEENVRATLTVADRAANQNRFAGSLLMPMALAVGVFLTVHRLVIKVVAVVAMAAIAAGIGITVSRGAILSLCLLVLFMVYRMGVQWRLIVVGLVLVSLLGLMPDIFFARMSELFSGDETTGAGRTEIWGVGIQALEEYWLFGSGLQNFTETYARYTVLGPQDFAKSAHNIYLGRWVELGIVGLALMLAAIGAHFVAALRVPRGTWAHVCLYAVEAGCVAILAHSFFSDRLWLKDFWMAWILLAWSVRLVPEDFEPDLRHLSGVRSHRLSR